MYLIRLLKGAEAKALAAEAPPFGPAFDRGVVARTETLELWGTKFQQEGPDYCVYKALDGAGTKIAEFKLGGY